jgi:beta-lactam-binding protein with PASTA domain
MLTARARQVLQGAPGHFSSTLTDEEDQACNYLGAVMSQVPSAGTLVPVGTTVQLSIGKKPPKPFVCK